jgi:peptidoglycan/LPS O-acetylase OafA/YrhL
MTARNEILPLTSLRFAAALYVFLFHFNLSLPIAATTGVVGRILAHGAIGMSLFFILSGFVLAFRFKDGVKNIQSYAFMRFSRIYPVYLLAALLAVPMLMTSLAKWPADTSIELGRYAFIVFANVVLIQAWLPQLFAFWNDGGSWSISVEALFYALFPIVVNPLRKLSDRGLYISLIIFFIGSAIPGISYVLFPNPPNFTVFYAIPVFRLCEFMAGVTCGLLFARGTRLPAPGLMLVFCTAILLAYVAYGPDYGFVFIADNWAVVPAFTGLIFSSACLTSGLLYKLITNKLVVGLGHISYSFYSIQFLILMLIMNNRVVLANAIPSLASNRALCFATLVTLSLASAITYYSIEVKFRDYLNRKWFRKMAAPPPVGPALVRA